MLRLESLIEATIEAWLLRKRRFPTKTAKAPENRPSLKGNHLPTTHFQVRTVSFREGNISHIPWKNAAWKMIHFLFEMVLFEKGVASHPIHLIGGGKKTFIRFTGFFSPSTPSPWSHRKVAS